MIFGKARTKTKRLTGLGSRFSIFMATLLSLGASSLVSLGYGEMEEVSVPSSPSLPKGDNSLSKFASSLSETHGFGGKISFDASFLNNDKKTSSVLHLEEGTLSFYKDEETAFHLEGSLSYDRANLPLLLHYSDENAYLSILGARYSYKTSDFDSLFDSIISIFGKDSIKIPDSFYSWIDKLFNASSDGNKKEIESNFALESDSSEGHLFSWRFENLFDGKIYFSTDAYYGIESIYADSLKGDGFNCSFRYDVSKQESSLANIRSLTPKDASSYSPIVNSMGLVRKISDIVKSKKAGISFKGNLKNKTNFSKKETVVEDFDLQGFTYFDVNKKRFHGKVNVGGYDLDGKRGETSLSFFTNILGEDSWKAFVDYNDMMKLSMTSLTFDEVLGLFEQSKETTGLAHSVVSFLQNNPLMKDIENGRYSEALELIENIESDNNLLRLNLSLNPLGLGEDSHLSLTLNAQNKGVSEAIFENTTFGSVSIEKLIITLEDFVDFSYSEEGYFEMDGLPTFASQMQNLFQKKRANLSLEASVLDASGLGYPEISGNVFFDLNDGKKMGSGDVTLKHKVEDGGTKNNHVRVDVTGALDSDVTRFHYNDGDSNNEGMRGQMTIKDLNSVIGLAIGLYNDNDPRFAKFFDPLRAALTSNAIGALTANRFGPFVASKVILLTDLSKDAWRFKMDANAFGLQKGTTFDVVLSFKNDEITSIQLVDLKTDEQTINATIKLVSTDFEDSNLSIVNDFKDGNYYQFDGIDSLLKAALNESKRETFHLYSDSFKVSLDILSFIKGFEIDMKMDFSIHVKNEVVKVYGVVSNINNRQLLFGSGLFRHHQSAAQYNKRTAVIYYDNVDYQSSSIEEKALPDQKGYLYVAGFNVYKKTLIGAKEEKIVDDVVKYSTNQLSDTKTVLHLVLFDILGIDLEKNLDSMLGTKQTATAYENLLTNYQFDTSSSGPSWKLGVDLSTLANASVLKKLNVQIQGGAKGTTSEDYLASLTLPKQQLLNIGLFEKLPALSAEMFESMIYNAAPGEDYWTSGGKASWESFLKDGRSMNCTSYNGLSS